MTLRRSLLGQLGRSRMSPRSLPWSSRVRGLSTEAGSPGALGQSSLGQNESIQSMASNAVAVSSEAGSVYTNSPAPVDTLTADIYNIQNNQGELLGDLGSTRGPFYQPHTLVTNPPSPKDVTLELLLASEAHQGHKTSLWNPSNARYIFGIRQGIHIISLEVTAAHLRRAAKIVTEVTRRAGIVLFVGTRSGQQRCVVKAAELSGGYHVFERWVPGSITNGEQILGNCRLKAVDEFDNEIHGLGEQLMDRASVKPDLVICLNPVENSVLLQECGQCNIPTIGIIDTNADPSSVTYPIPANDDSLRCVQVIAGVLGRAGEEGRKMRLEAASNGSITYTPTKDLKVPNKDDED